MPPIETAAVRRRHRRRIKVRVALEVLEQLAPGLDVRRLLAGGLERGRASFVGDEAVVDDVVDDLRYGK